MQGNHRRLNGRQNIFGILKKLNFPEGCYVIVGGAVLAALGMRATDDIDIVVTNEFFQKCREEGWIEIIAPNKKPKLVRYLQDNPIKKIELYLDVNAGDFNPSTEDLIKRSILIEGFPFISLPDLTAFKRSYGRPKDMTDLDLLDQCPL